MANKATATAKQPLTIAFLLGNRFQFDTEKTFVNSRKIDSKDMSENAKRFLQVSAKETSSRMEFINQFKTKLFTSVFLKTKQKIAKDIILSVFIETNYLDNLDCIDKTLTNLQKRFKENSIDEKQFLSALKTMLKSHYDKTEKCRSTAIENMSDKAKELLEKSKDKSYDGIKANFVQWLANDAKKQAEKAEKKTAPKTPKTAPKTQPQPQV